MTFSIVASNHKTGEICVATATCFVAVGERVPKILPKVGAVAVQASPKPSNREDILQLMGKGYSPKKAINKVIKNDTKKENRQIAAINLKGESYVFSGKKTIEITDSYLGQNFVIAGNMLLSDSVVTSMANSFINNLNSFFPKKLLDSLKAGEKAGGDKRGRMSAAILYSKPKFRTMTLRIDFSKNPLSDISKALEYRYLEEYKNIYEI